MSEFTARSLRGQGATEYLVLLAVVLIVAMVAIALLGFFPGMSYDAKASEAETYWQSARPIQILEHGQTGKTLTMVISNVDPNQIKIVDISIGGGTFYSNVSASGINLTAAYLSTGETRVIVAPNTLGSAANCSSGTIYEYMVNFTYSTSIANQRQFGAKSIIGKCA